MAHGQSLSRLFSAGNEAYFRGDYATAVEHYQQLLAAGVRDPDVYFNLATAHARSGDCGRAILRFEQSLLLDPGHEAAESGVRRCRSALGRQRAQREGEATVQARPPLHEAAVRGTSENALAVVALVFEVLLFGLLFALGRARYETLRVGLGIALTIAAVGLVATGSGLIAKSGAWTRGDPAIVLEENVPLREGPDPRALSRSRGRAGQAGHILRREGRFRYVRLANGREGWMEASHIEGVRPH